jgi:hypothetical protein
MPIAGATRLTTGDTLAFMILWLPIRTFWFLAIGIPFWVALWCFSVSHSFWNDAVADPIWGLEQTFQSLWPIILAAGVGWPVAILGWSIYQSWRLLASHKALTFVVDDIGFVTKDGTGASLTLPWARIKRVRRNKRLFLMLAVGGAWRYAPWRAFSTADQEALLLLAQTHVGS